MTDRFEPRSDSSMPGDGGMPTGDNRPGIPRELLAEQWRTAPLRCNTYSAGVTQDGLAYPEGKRLIIAGEQVMDTCETPWCIATIDSVFEGMANGHAVRVLERGFGLGIMSNRILQKLIGLGRGEHHIIELNGWLADKARQWADHQKRWTIPGTGRGVPLTQPQINITIHSGEAYKVTRQLAEAGERFDIIVSDTYPLNEDERGVNDLLDLGNVKRCLTPGGRFTFAAHFPGSTGGVVGTQRDLILEHFGSYAVREVEIVGPPDYHYLQEGDTSVRKLPIVVCSAPKL